MTTHDEFPEAADYARSKIGELGRYTSRPMLQARVKLTRHRDPAVPRPVVAQANLDVDGRLVRAQVQAETAREAVDLLAARLRRRLERIAEHWEARRGELPSASSHEWRHDSEPTHRPNYFPVQQMSAVSSVASRSRWRPAPSTRPSVKWTCSTTTFTCSLSKAPALQLSCTAMARRGTALRW